MKTQRDRENASKDYALEVMAEPETVPAVKPFPIVRARLNSTNDTRANVIVETVNSLIGQKSREKLREAFYWFNGTDSAPAIIDAVCGVYEAEGYTVETGEPTSSGSLLLRISW